MSKHNRTEVLKVLKQQMEATSDLKEKAEIAKQIAKLLPRPRQARRPRKAEATPIKAKAGTSLLTKVHGNAVDWLSPEKKLIHFVVSECEKRRKEHWQRTGKELTEVERKAFLMEAKTFIMAQLTAEDHALLVAGEAEKGC